MTKNLRSTLASLLLLALPVAPTFGQEPAAGKKKASPPPFELTVAQVVTPDIARAERAVTQIRERVKTGLEPSERLKEMEEQLDIAYQRRPYLLSLKSNGGPLSAFATAAAGSPYPGETSFTLINAADPADLETPLPPFELKNANWGTVIGVLGHLLNPRGLDLRFVGGDNPDPAAAKSVVCVLRRTDAASDAKRTARTELESFQIGDNIFKDQTVEVIVDAIRTAWELVPGNDPAALHIKFHPATKLLLVSGPAPATHIARQVVAGLRKKPAPLI